MYRGPRGTSPILYAVMHVNVGPEVEGGARGLASYLNNNGPTGGGYQTISDDKELIRVANDDEIVYGAGGVNHNAVHHCFIGSADQTRDQWLDAYSRGELNFGAKQTREWCNLYGLPIAKLEGPQIANRAKGICGHVDVNKSGLPGTVWPGGHYDPGPNFPWDVYLPLINGDAPTPPPVPPKPKGHELTFFFRVPDAATDAGRKDVYVSNGIVYERTTADQLKALLFVAGGQGLPTNIGTMTKAQIGNMERVGP